MGDSLGDGFYGELPVHPVTVSAFFMAPKAEWDEVRTWALANYYSDASLPHDTSPTRTSHPDYREGGDPLTSPVGSFAPNGYGLYDMAGNMWEWCRDSPMTSSVE